MTEKPQVRFHIHIDANEMSNELYETAKSQLGYFDQHFAEGQNFGSGYRVVAPQKHITKQFFEHEKEAFYDAWDAITDLADQGGLTGYIEGEYIAFDYDFPDKPYCGDGKPPFKLDLRPLTGPPNEEFRQTELHLVMDEERSDPQLIQSLLDTGMYPARLPKAASENYPAHMAIVFTVQGYKNEIGHLAEQLTDYLLKVGGTVRASLKEERILRYKLYDITYKELPEII